MPFSAMRTSSTPLPDQGMQGTLACCATMVDEILSPRDRMAEPGGPMKTIFLGDAASDSGSFGFSDAWPLTVSLNLMPWTTYHPAQTACTSILSATSTIRSTLA